MKRGKPSSLADPITGILPLRPAAEAKPSLTALCRVCKKRARRSGTYGHRCEDCWADAASHWCWQGIHMNALKHPRRN